MIQICPLFPLCLPSRKKKQMILPHSSQHWLWPTWPGWRECCLRTSKWMQSSAWRQPLPLEMCTPCPLRHWPWSDSGCERRQRSPCRWYWLSPWRTRILSTGANLVRVAWQASSGIPFRNTNLQILHKYTRQCKLAVTMNSYTLA